MRHYISPTLASALTSRSTFLILVAALAGAVGIFVVPWFVPLRHPVASISYTYGFNNFVSWLAVAALLAALFLILLLRRDTLGPSLLERTLSEILPDGNRSRNSRGLFATFLAVVVFGAVLQIVWYVILPTNYYGEIKQHISRLDLMTLGQRPHFDFEYAYGPGMLYAAYGLFRLFAGVVSVDAAYCTTLIAYWVLGMYLAYYVIKSFNGAVERITVFLGISLLFFHPSMMGLQYTPMRYFLPLASVLLIHRSLPAMVPPGLWWSHAWMAALAFLLPLAALAFSPEAGIPTTLAVTAYFLALIRAPHRMFAWCALAAALAAATALVCFGRDYLHAAFSYSSSASCFPVFPAVFVCIFLAAACLILPNLAILGLKQRTPVGSLGIAFTVALGLGIPASLGRCDLVHLCLNGIGLLMFGLALLTLLRARRFYYLLLYAYVLVFPSSELTGMLWLGYGDMSLKALHVGIFDAMDADEISLSFTRSAKPPSDAVNERVTEGDKLVIVTRQLSRSGCLVMTISHKPRLQDSLDIDPRRRRSYWKPRYFPPDLRELLRYPKVGTPFGATEDIDRFLKLTDRFVPEYWPSPGSTVNVWSVADVNRKLSDLRAMDVLLIPKSVYLGDTFLTIPINSDLTLQLDHAVLRKTAIRVLSQVNMFPVWLPKPRTPPFYPEVQMMAEISRHYLPAGEFRSYVIAEKRSKSVNDNSPAF